MMIVQESDKKKLQRKKNIFIFLLAGKSFFKGADL